MDPITNTIASLASGLVGAVAGFFQAKQEIEKRKLEIAAEGKRMDHELAMGKLNADIAVQEGEARAFAASLESAKGDTIAIPEGANWFVQLLLGGGWFVRTITRPGLTWFYSIGALFNADLIPLASMSAGWWFGQRGGTRYMTK